MGWPPDLDVSRFDGCREQVSFEISTVVHGTARSFRSTSFWAVESIHEIFADGPRGRLQATVLDLRM